MLSGRPLVLSTLFNTFTKLSLPNPNLSEFIRLEAALSLTGSLGVAKNLIPKIAELSAYYIQNNVENIKI